jgi:hypothetical protein
VSYLSIVYSCNNRGYGNDFIGRTQACIDNLFYLSAKVGLDADVTFVEWNPPLDKPRVSQVLNWQNKTLPVRFIEVPEEVHNRVPNPRNTTFWEMWAKNIGIRRATGDYVLSANPDNIYSEALIARLKSLEPGTFYRTDSYDTLNGEVFQIHRACESLVHRADGWKPNGSPGFVVPEADGKFPYPPLLGRLEPLHFNKSGDFFLMAREQWHIMHGHPETDYTVTTDGETVYLAAAHGWRQIVLPEPTYHLHHSRDERHCPSWSDAAPHGRKNGTDWGFAGHEFFTYEI